MIICKCIYFSGILIQVKVDSIAIGLEQGNGSIFPDSSHHFVGRALKFGRWASQAIYTCLFDVIETGVGGSWGEVGGK